MILQDLPWKSSWLNFSSELNPSSLIEGHIRPFCLFVQQLSETKGSLMDWQSKIGSNKSLFCIGDRNYFFFTLS